jgi:RNA polymerase-binding transcription factor DksA
MKAPHPGHRACMSTGFPPSMDTGGYLVMLEELWRQKVDQIVVLSMAYHDDVPADTVHALTSRHACTDTVLMNRVMQAHEDLALIEDAIDRIKDGTYGICGSCARPIGTEWLSETPYVRDCPGCCPSQITWQPADAPSTAGSPAIAS